VSTKIKARQRFSIVVPRWARVRNLIDELVFLNKVELTSISVDKGWIRETIMCEVSGTLEQVNEFSRNLQTTANNWNLQSF
jgi:hypothetical protein